MKIALLLLMNIVSLNLTILSFSLHRDVLTPKSIVKNPQSSRLTYWRLLPEEIQNIFKEKLRHWLGITSPQDYSKTVGFLLKQDDADHLALVVNFLDQSNKGILFDAIAECASACTKLLIRYPEIDVNWQDDAGTSALHVAVSHAQPGGIGLMLACAGLQQCRSTDTKFSWHQCVELLLKNPNINVNVTNKQNLTPLHLAALCNHPEYVYLLLQHAQLNTNLKGQTDLSKLNDCYIKGKSFSPLELCILFDRLECGALLISDPRTQTNIFLPPLDLVSSEMKEIVQHALNTLWS